MKIKKFDIALITAMLITLIFATTQTNSFNETNEKIIRFHVLANSNENHDQELKLKVKNEVFEYVSKLTENETSKDTANTIISNNLENINNLAKEIVYENGYCYNVQTTLDTEFYPQKDYEDFSLPAGMYYGLKINIGEALGENWWCVLYPPLCNQTAFDTKDLTDEDLEFIGQTDYEFRFKFIEIYSNIKKVLN